MDGRASGGHRARGDSSHIRLTYVTHFYFNEPKSDFLVDLLRTYASYERSLLDVTQFVLVDDASPVRPSIPGDLDLNLLLLRIHEDIPWNQPGARNLGMVYARSDRVVLTDVDHEFPEQVLRHIVGRRVPKRNVYKLRRTDLGGRPLKAHPNTFVLSRARFLELHGYDEDFSGHYGYDDAMFWRWQRNHGTRFLYLPRALAVKARTEPRLRHHSLNRDLAHNARLAAHKRRQWKRLGPQTGHSRRWLHFTWSVEEDRRRSTLPPTPNPRPLWASTWWWRWLWG
jgi:hypothetical protein